MGSSRSHGVLKLLIWLVLVGGVVAAGVSTGILDPIEAPTQAEVEDAVGGPLADMTSPTSSSPPQPAVSEPPSAHPDNQSGLNRSRLEYAIHEQINDVREKYGLTQLRFDSELRAPARYHSQDMATNDYFAHESPTGETVQDRYERFNYECRVSMDGNRYATGGENIAQTWYEESVRTDNGTVYYDSVDDLADGIVHQWMQSPGHRENILREFWQTEAIGVAVTEMNGQTAVYATQNFC